MNKKELAVKEFKDAKLVPWSKSMVSKFKLRKISRAGIIFDKSGAPQLFIFDTSAFMDLLTGIDDTLVDRLTDEEYNSKEANPAGWLIDQIETQIPLNPKFVQSLKDAIKEADRRGWIPFSKIQKNIGLK